MIIPLGESNFSSGTQLLTQTGKMSEVNQPRNETWVYMINDHVIDYYDHYVMTKNIIIKKEIKMVMVSMHVNLLLRTNDDDDL